MSKILEIKEVYDLKMNHYPFIKYDGYKIQTEQDVYYLLIENEQQCFEDWGYICSNDDLDNYTGKELLNIEIVDMACNKMKVCLDNTDICENECMFINLKLEGNDEVQFAVYNSHNGYYGHRVLFCKNDEIIKDNEL